MRLKPASGFMSGGDRIQVERDGALLRGCPAHPVYDVRQATYALWCIGGLNVVLGGVIAAFR